VSRIGKKPIGIPENVTVKIDAGVITIKGPKGELDWKYPISIKVTMNGGTILVERSGESGVDRALHGLTRSIISNMVTGVSQGYQIVLEIVGVGYRAQVSGSKLVLSLGYSNPVEYSLPDGITASLDQKQTQITLTGIDKQQIGHVAACIKALRPPDAYKGKGVRLKGERLKLKVGKAGKK
jgi:large subunit ribosomal protein L6